MPRSRRARPRRRASIRLSGRLLPPAYVSLRASSSCPSSSGWSQLSASRSRPVSPAISPRRVEATLPDDRPPRCANGSPPSAAARQPQPRNPDRQAQCPRRVRDRDRSQQPGYHRRRDGDRARPGPRQPGAPPAPVNRSAPMAPPAFVVIGSTWPASLPYCTTSSATISRYRSSTVIWRLWPPTVPPDLFNTRASGSTSHVRFSPLACKSSRKNCLCLRLSTRASIFATSSGSSPLSAPSSDSASASDPFPDLPSYGCCPQLPWPSEKSRRRPPGDPQEATSPCMAE